jgi:hypothetical protein
MALAIPISLGIGSLLASLFGRGGKKTTSEASQQGTSNLTTTQAVAPQYQEMQDLMIQNLMKRMQSPVPIAGYEASGLDAINKTWEAANLRSQNALSARGLLDSPIASLSNEQSNAARAGEQAAWINKMPLLQREMQMDDLKTTLAAIAGAPRTSQQWGTTSGTQTAAGTTGPSSPFAEGLGNMMNLLAYLFASGKGGQGSSSSPGQTFFGDTG